MAKSSREYWREREEEQRRHNITDEAEYRQEVERIYRRMMSEMQKEISDFYVKYAKKEGITISEAKRRARRLDMKEYSEKAKEYVKNRDFSPQANAEMDLYNMTMKVNRLELLKAELGMHVVGGYDEMQKFFEQKLSDRTLAEFQRQGGILGETVQNNGELINAIVNASFHNASFSDRIWGQYAGFKSSLEREITRGLIRGIGAAQLAANIRKTCIDVSSRDAMRLMVTELARVSTEAAKQSMEKNGNTEYEFMALGPNPCPICRGLNGKIFKVKEMQPGENAPPMHPWCHCATAPHWDEKTYQDWLDSGAAKAGAPFEKHEDISQISMPINARHSVGTPPGVAIYGDSLSGKQQKILNQLQKYDDRIVVNKRSVSMKDIAAITAHEGVEFALFTRKGKRLIIRGGRNDVNIDGENMKELAKKGYKWSGHTHPVLTIASENSPSSARVEMNRMRG